MTEGNGFRGVVWVVERSTARFLFGCRSQWWGLAPRAKFVDGAKLPCYNDDNYEVTGMRCWLCLNDAVQNCL